MQRCLFPIRVSLYAPRAVVRRTFATANLVPDYYAVLGVTRSASAEQIKAAFRERAKLYHPDVNLACNNNGDASDNSSVSLSLLPPPPGVDPHASALDIFKLINEAYGVLSEPNTRRDYDDNRFSRTDLLRRRNEGWTPGDVRRSSGNDVVNYDADARAPPQVEDFRDSMARASAKYADGQRGRATLARVNRQRVRSRRGGNADVSAMYYVCCDADHVRCHLKRHCVPMRPHNPSLPLCRSTCQLKGLACWQP